jgi:type IV pilus assembly protein PilV
MRKQVGFTLIEILVTVLIMGIALLGLAGMQAVGLQQSQSTYFRTQADLLARDLADRMRATRNGAAPEVDATGQRDANNGFYLFGGGAAPAGACVGANADCTAEEMAEQDLSEWVGAVNDLPAGDAFVTAESPSLLRIQIVWDERRNGAQGLGCDPTDEDDLACLFLNVEI